MKSAAGSPTATTSDSPIASRTRARSKTPKPWIAIASRSETPSGRPKGASTAGVQSKIKSWLECKHEVQQQVGGWLGLFLHMPVVSRDILSEEECKYIALALQHNKVHNRTPCTEEQYEELRTTEVSLLKGELAQAKGEEVTESLHILADRLELKCQCELHMYVNSVGRADRFATWLCNVMGSAAECQGALYSGNLGRIAIELVKMILENAGFPHLYVQTEGKSKACGFGSMVTYIFGNEEESVYVEGTPDFFARTTHPYYSEVVYVLIGECESKNSSYPDNQLAITALGHLLHPLRDQITAVLLTKRPLSATVFLGDAECTHDKTYVRFKSVNNNRGYILTDSGEIGAFAKTLATVVQRVHN